MKNVADSSNDEEMRSKSPREKPSRFLN